MKNISKMVLMLTGLLATILTALRGFATPPSFGIEAGLGLTRPAKYGAPFRLYFSSRLDAAPEVASVDITLPVGLEHRAGPLHWEGSVKSDSLYIMNLQVCINNPGTYEVSVVVNASKFRNSGYEKSFPLHRSVFLYAREDTIIMFRNRADLDQAIRDSLVFPGVATRRYYARQESLAVVEKINKKLPPDIANDDLPLFAARFLLLSDSIPISKLSDFYTPKQVAPIKKHDLLYSPPRFDRVEKAIAKDCQLRFTPEQIQSLVQKVKRQFTELYEIDQQIVRCEQPDEREKLLRIRYRLETSQLKERIEALNLKW